MQSERAQVQHVQSEKQCEIVLNINFLALIYQKHVKSDQISTLHLTSEMVKRDGPSVVAQAWRFFGRKHSYGLSQVTYIFFGPLA